MQNPLISIIIPVFNFDSLIEETLDSVIAQTYSNWECIIINDGSKDQSEETIRNYISGDSRFQYYSKENGGSASARYFGFKKSIGEFIIFLDGDDIIKPDKLSKSIEVLKSNKNIEIIITNYAILDKRFKELLIPTKPLASSDFNFKTLLLDWDIRISYPTHCCLYRREIFINFSFDLEVKAKEDWLMTMEAFKRSKKFHFINEPLAIYRFHENSKMKRPEYYQNVRKTFDYIFENKIDLYLHEPFFNKVNAYWIKIINEKDSFNRTIIHSSKFKVGSLIVNPLIKLKTLIHKIYIIITKTHQ